MLKYPLRVARRNLNLKITDVERETGIPRSTYQRIETGNANVSKKHARILYNFFGGAVSLSDIYDPHFGKLD